jgi:hypothetical protein
VKSGEVEVEHGGGWKQRVEGAVVGLSVYFYFYFVRRSWGSAGVPHLTSLLYYLDGGQDLGGTQCKAPTGRALRASGAIF